MLRERRGLKEIQVEAPPKKTKPELGGGSNGNGTPSKSKDAESVVLISLGAQSVVSIWSMLPLLIGGILILN